MVNDIKLIWNELWKIYKEFKVDHDVKEYTRKASELVHKFVLPEHRDFLGAGHK